VKGLNLSSCKHDWSSMACKGCIEGKQGSPSPRMEQQGPPRN
jgi:hypothetical protein